MKPHDSPLQVFLRKGELTIKIGAHTLAFADLQRRDNEREGPSIRIIDPLQFAVDVIKELQHEDELGATPLTDLLDKMMDSAIERGSCAVEET